MGNLENDASERLIHAPPIWKQLVFVKLWFGDVLSRVGQQTVQYLLPLAVLVYLHGSGLQTGIISATQSIAILVFSLAAGVIADRRPTNTMIVSGVAGRAIALALFGVICLTIGPSLTVLIGVAFIVGSASVFYDVGYQSSIPRLISKSQLVQGNSLLQSTSSAAQMLGPALAGICVAILGLVGSIGLAVTVFVGAFLVFHIWMRSSWSTQQQATTNSNLPTILGGLKFIVRTRPIRDLCIQSGLFNLHEGAFLTAFMVFGVRTAQLPVSDVGMLIGVGSVGTVLGSLTASRMASILNVGRSLVVGLIVGSCAFVIGPILWYSCGVALGFAAVFFLSGMAIGRYNVFAISLRQTIPPSEYLGSVTAGYRFVSFGVVPIGNMFGGFLCDQLPTNTALLTIGMSMAACSLLILRSPVRTLRQLDDLRC